MGLHDGPTRAFFFVWKAVSSFKTERCGTAGSFCKFIIHSLRIKYKDDRKTLYYPSIKAHQLRQISKLKWNVDKTLIDKFKNWSNAIGFNGPLMDNLPVYPQCLGQDFGHSDRGKYCDEVVPNRHINVIIYCLTP